MMIQPYEGCLEETMDPNRIKGAWKKTAGEVKEAAGQAVGNEKLRLKGRAEQIAGTAQNTLGRVKDALRGR
jgi:uncharacterized protein YjbJ (UPF0337 family)